MLQHSKFDCMCRDRKSTRLNSSHTLISYAVFCLKKKIISNSANSSDVRDKVYGFGGILCLLLVLANSANSSDVRYKVYVFFCLMVFFFLKKPAPPEINSPPLIVALVA